MLVMSLSFDLPASTQAVRLRIDDRVLGAVSDADVSPVERISRSRVPCRAERDTSPDSGALPLAASNHSLTDGVSSSWNGWHHGRGQGCPWPGSTAGRGRGPGIRRTGFSRHGPRLAVLGGDRELHAIALGRREHAALERRSVRVVGVTPTRSPSFCRSTLLVSIKLLDEVSAFLPVYQDAPVQTAPSATTMPAIACFFNSNPYFQKLMKAHGIIGSAC
ncbi:hypothetical protein FQR65_LT18489 [Abscondita terminalis]|nr:hypothetical protein FQR65_LT18489 [Abscondita terminalis]